jgi:uncharacterized protein (DUF1499 family)
LDCEDLKALKTLKRFAVTAALIAAGMWIVAQFVGRKPPAGLGVSAAGLAECPDTPNCVCSDCEHGTKMGPLEFTSNADDAKAALMKALAAKGIRVVEHNDNYIHAVATTPIMRFKDDLEFLIEPHAKRIQFRSASRLGKSDMGKNRARLEEIFALLAKDGFRVAATNVIGN